VTLLRNLLLGRSWKSSLIGYGTAVGLLVLGGVQDRLDGKPGAPPVTKETVLAAAVAVAFGRTVKDADVSGPPKE